MSHTPHRLADDFPEFRARIAELRESDRHFARLAEDYEAVNDEIHLSEINVHPLEDLAEVLKRKERGALKDAIYAMLSRAPA
ncbi:hypothetical protein OCH239_14520 [Roseivivax halodurans JCM 10272]|uniref:GTP-binding protein n=1 Tax=Roseivivax halodurans JCM 10272 TaxID=1449350 RepID=X7EIC7_9RHOB|nr:DUF465 domain-containing protein [Roseivivax halodurans]ETX15650.1 hypothetical protein OCH239_14520 [Roseivivax halodurans JCM 10272]